MRWSATSSATCSPRVTSSFSAAERLGAGGRAHDPVALAELAAQVARDGGEHGGLVVDGDDRGRCGGGARMPPCPLTLDDPDRRPDGHEVVDDLGLRHRQPRAAVRGGVVGHVGVAVQRPAARPSRPRTAARSCTGPTRTAAPCGRSSTSRAACRCPTLSPPMPVEVWIARTTLRAVDQQHDAARAVDLDAPARARGRARAGGRRASAAPSVIGPTTPSRARPLQRLEGEHGLLACGSRTCR